MEEVVAAAKLLADLGGTVIVTAMLYVVWQRLNVVTDALLRLLAEMAKRDEVAAAKDNATSTEPLPTPEVKPVIL